MTAALHQPTSPTASPVATRRLHVSTPSLQLSTTPAAAVFRTVRLRGPLFRDAVATATGLSSATVNRQVGALLAAGLLRERADLSPAGAIGRPRLPVEVNHTAFVTVGLHIGFKVTVVTAHDLHGRIIGGLQLTTVPDPGASVPEILRAIGLRTKRFLARWASRRVLWAGVAIGGRVHPNGRVDHPRLGWTDAPVGEVLSASLGLPVSVAPHVEAMAAAELMLTPETSPRESTLYFYAREMVGVSLTINGAVHTPTSGPGTLGHLPTGGTTLLDPRRTGRLEAAVGDTGLVDAAVAVGLAVTDIAQLHEQAAAGQPTAVALLSERALVLGRAVGLISDIINPDHIILGGQAFTDAPQTLREVAAAINTHSAAPQRDVRVTAAGEHVQQQAAGAVSLAAVFSEPLAALRHTAL
ncbi:ROK family protein [Rhodococcus sp. X156]|uniref:ROK family transcriptional regulator n=1 Tax=Rhodococcus sp. X156 TaxID=2499145 RepID=UPI000FD84809|nr:ROK family protein [Rhodococcus sp. X156]